MMSSKLNDNIDILLQSLMQFHRGLSTRNMFGFQVQTIRFQSTSVSQSSVHGSTWLLVPWTEHISIAALQQKIDTLHEIERVVCRKTALHVCHLL